MKLYIFTLIAVLMFSFVGLGQTFSTEWANVPSTFLGNKPSDIYSALREVRKSSEKGEFETTAEYEARMKNPGAVKLGKNLSSDNDLIFVYRPGEKYSSYGLATKYDADQQTMEFTIKSRGFSERSKTDATNNYKTLQFFGTEVTSIEFTKTGSYEGENGFGVKRTIQEYMAFTYYLGIANATQFDGYSNKYFPTIISKAKIPIETAKNLKNNIAVLYVAKLTTPYSASDYIETKPTISSPTKTRAIDALIYGNVAEIWFFNNSTGEIVHKIKPDSKKK